MRMTEITDWTRAIRKFVRPDLPRHIFQGNAPIEVNFCKQTPAIFR